MSIIAVSIGIVYSYIETRELQLLKYIVVLLGALSFHASVNLWNDYFDYKRKVDFSGSPTTIYRPHPIVTGGLTERETYFYALSASMFGLTLGAMVYILWNNFWGIIWGAAGMFLAYIYSGSPLNTKYRALGEVEVFAVWGMLFSLGAYTIITGKLSLSPMLLSMPFGFLVAAVLTANNTRDIDYDSSRNIKTLSIILGKRGSLRLLKAEILAAYILTLVLVQLEVSSIYTLITILSLKKAYSTLKIFEKEVPANADPIVASVAIQFGLLFLTGMILSMIF